MTRIKYNNYFASILALVCNFSINSCLAQNQSFQMRSGWGIPYSHNYLNDRNYNYIPYQPHLNLMPSASYSHGTYQNAVGESGKVVEAVKASIHPLHIGEHVIRGIYHYNRPQPLPMYSNSPILSTPASLHTPTQYSGYFYAQDKHKKPSSTLLYTNQAHFPANNLWTPIPNHPPTSAYQPLLQPSQPPQHSTPVITVSHVPPRLPGIVPSGPVAGANMETYQEALNLFSEVVRKLEKEPRHGHDGVHTYSGSASSLLQNGIYGSSIPQTTVGGFPPHLDHIMGPEFLQRAHKLYNKIIKEQNAKLVSEQQVPSHAYPYRQHQYSPHILVSQPQYLRGEAEKSYGNQGYGGLSYLERAIHGHNPFRKTSYGRNMNEESNARSSVVENVKALEIPVNSSPFVDSVGSASTEEMLMTSESKLEEVKLSDKEVDSLQKDGAVMSALLENAETSTTQPFSRKNPPRNDFVEHPLPYEEYEGLIKEIAINHDYKK